MWGLWLVSLVCTVGAVALQEAPGLRVGAVHTVPAVGAVTFLALAVAWLWHDRPRRRSMLAATAVAGVAVQVLTTTALDHDPLTAVRTAVAVTVQAAVMLAFYRWRVGDDNLAPHRPRDLVDLLLASLAGAGVGALFGPLHELPLGGGASGRDVLAWVLLATGYAFVAGSCAMLLVQRSPTTEAVATRLLDVYLQLVVTALCLGAVVVFPDQPITWLALLPAIWAGMTMGPWTSAAYGLTAALAVVAAQGFALTVAVERTSSALPGVVILDVLMAAFVFVVLLLSLLRDQRAWLGEEVRRRRQEAVDQAGLLETVFESISDALVLVGTDGRVRLHNRAASLMLGQHRLESEASAWLRRPREPGGFTYAVAGEGSGEGPRILAVQLADVQHAGSAGVVAVCRDVTSEQQRIEELTSFAAVAAHDLKSPLAAVQGWIEVAEDALWSDTRTVESALRHTRNATARMSREVDDWLTYNVAREGVVRPEPVQLQPVVEAVAASHPGADFYIHAPDAVLVDPTLLQHLLVNLVGNAVKYTPPGQRPSVTVRSFTGGRSGWVRLYVVDEGIGIPEGEERSIFEPFHRAASVAGRFEGSGLGLALCQRIVRRHGGEIEARRNEGAGTTISVTLPHAA